jgi:hypothetical protein
MINPFNFDLPRFAQLRYTDLVIGDQAYFLLTWELERGDRLRIKCLNYRSSKSRGSAYIVIPEGVDSVELVISSLWKSVSKNIPLLREPIAAQVDFFPVLQLEELTARSVYSPQPNLLLKTPQPGATINKLQVPAFAIHTKNINQP